MGGIKEGFIKVIRKLNKSDINALNCSSFYSNTHQQINELDN